MIYYYKLIIIGLLIVDLPVTGSSKHINLIITKKEEIN